MGSQFSHLSNTAFQFFHLTRKNTAQSQVVNENVTMKFKRKVLIKVWIYCASNSLLWQDGIYSQDFVKEGFKTIDFASLRTCTAWKKPQPLPKALGQELIRHYHVLERYTLQISNYLRVCILCPLIIKYGQIMLIAMSRARNQREHPAAAKLDLWCSCSISCQWSGWGD